MPSYAHACLLVVICILTFCTESLLLAQETVLIRNVTIIDRVGEQADITGSIFIESGKLAWIARDSDVGEAAELDLDGNTGFLLGNITLGLPGSFMILDEDPREDINVLLDTKAHTIFAIHDGQIEINTLATWSQDSTRQQGFTGWLSYTPPAVAMPVSYRQDNKWNVIKTKPINIVLGGAVLLENTRWIDQNAENEEQIGDLDQFDGGSIRGLRIGLGGTINFKRPWTYVFAGATTAFERGVADNDQKDFLIFDYRLDIPVGKINLSIGKQKEPISMERMMPLIYIPAQQERTAVLDGFLPARNVGLVANGMIANRRMSWAVGVFNPWFDSGIKLSESPTAFVGRISGVPFESRDQSNLIHLGFGMRRTNARQGIRYKSKTEIFRGATSVDTDLLDANSATTYSVEMGWRIASIIVLSEFVNATVQLPDIGAIRYHGYQLTTSYIITGEMLSYNRRNGTFGRLRVARAVNAGGWGAWDVYARWSSIDLTSDLNDGGKMNTFSLGVNWWPLSQIQCNINYRYSTLDRFGVLGKNQGLVTRIGFILE